MEDPFVLRLALDVTRRQLWDLQNKENNFAILCCLMIERVNPRCLCSVWFEYKIQDSTNRWMILMKTDLRLSSHSFINRKWAKFRKQQMNWGKKTKNQEMNLKDISIYSQLKTVTFIPLLLENHVTELTLTLESQEARYFSRSHDIYKSIYLFWTAGSLSWRKSSERWL